MVGYKLNAKYGNSPKSKIKRELLPSKRAKLKSAGTGIGPQSIKIGIF